jgi:hypothetical protein
VGNNAKQLQSATSPARMPVLMEGKHGGVAAVLERVVLDGVQ